MKRSILNDATGNVAIMFAICLFVMALMAGAGIDLAHRELIRRELQGSLDRGVLAAASLSQRQETEKTLRDYFKTLPYADDVTITIGSSIAKSTAREIAASASYVMKTAFLPLAGIDTMRIEVVASATEARQNLELSLILDVSGSMGENNRLGNLKVAARQFVEALLTKETRAYTSLSIVPFAGQVSAGAAVFDKLNPGGRFHDYSSCFEFSAERFGNLTPSFKNRQQIAHFTDEYFGRTDLQPWWCPVGETAITYHSNDASYLKARIDKLERHGGTGTQFGMQWGLMLLDPTGIVITNAAIAGGLMPKAFANRPAKFEDESTLKVIVLMTDGEVMGQYRPKDPYRSPDLPPDNKYITNKATAVEQLHRVCDLAKEKGVVVFTIGFEVEGIAHEQMARCATSRAHYFSVKGLQIAEAFKSISGSIRKLRLTQ